MERLAIRQDRCKGCGLCVKFCKKKVLYLPKKMNAAGYYFVEALNEADCSGCRDCQIMCPDRAITVVSLGVRNRPLTE
jgi:2-oxoglutarate ferredoxin oxidoreductase subunit delta